MSSEKRLEMRTIPDSPGTHSISRSFPLPPTRSACSPVSPLSPWLPAPRHTHTQSRPRGRVIQHHTLMQHSVWASPQSRGARLHRMRVAGNTLEASCCRTFRRRCAKRRLRRLLAAADHASASRRTDVALRVRALRTTKCVDSQHRAQGPGGEGRVSTRDSGARCKQVQCVAGGPAAEDSHTHLRDCGRELWGRAELGGVRERGTGAGLSFAERRSLR